MARSTAAIVLAGVLAFALGLLVQVPAPWLWQRMAPELPFQVSAVQGTLWQGRAALGPEPAPQQVHVHWQFVPAALVRGQLAWQFHVDNAQTDLQLLWQWRPRTHQFELNGRANMAQLDPWLSAQQLTAQGWLHISDVAFVLRPQTQALSAKGSFAWESGQIGLTWLDGQRYLIEALNVEGLFEPSADAPLNFKLQHRFEPITYVTAQMQDDGILRLQLLSTLRDVVPFFLPGGQTMLLDADIPMPMGLPL